MEDSNRAEFFHSKVVRTVKAAAHSGTLGRACWENSPLAGGRSTLRGQVVRVTVVLTGRSHPHQIRLVLVSAPFTGHLPNVMRALRTASHPIDTRLVSIVLRRLPPSAAVSLWPMLLREPGFTPNTYTAASLLRCYVILKQPQQGHSAWK